MSTCRNPYVLDTTDQWRTHGLWLRRKDLLTCRKEPEEYFKEGLCYFIPPLASLSRSLSLRLVLCLSSLPYLFGMMHTFVHPVTSLPLFPSSILSVVCPLLSRPHTPPTPPHPSSHSLDDFKWPRGKLFGVQVEFRRRPGSLSLFSLSKPTREILPWLPPDMGSASVLKAPRMAIVFSPMRLGLCVWSNELRRLRLTLGSLVFNDIFFCF